MNSGYNRPLKSGALFIGLLVMTTSLLACGEGDHGSGGQVGPAANTPVSAADEEATERYREKVGRRVSASVVGSLAREWGVPEEKVECLLVDLRVTQLEDGTTDTTVAAVFDRCGVDPEVVE